MAEPDTTSDRRGNELCRRGRRRAVAAGLSLLLLCACASPAEHFDATAHELGFAPQIVTGVGYRHVLFWKPGPTLSPLLHVYIDGDGTLTIAGYAVPDPTSRDPLTLRLMNLDPAPAVLLGRPCYNGLAGDAGCEPAVWTTGRYADAVVTSMAAVVRGILAQGPYRRVAWFGHSGGGSLAMLLAARIPETVAVVTVAANLDIDAWSDASGFGRLTGSLNPARQPPLPDSILQHHYAGQRDEVVPPSITALGVRRAADLTVVPDYDHRCCWEQLWPKILSDLSKSGIGP